MSNNRINKWIGRTLWIMILGVLVVLLSYFFPTSLVMILGFVLFGVGFFGMLFLLAYNDMRGRSPNGTD